MVTPRWRIVAAVAGSMITVIGLALFTAAQSPEGVVSPAPTGNLSDDGTTLALGDRTATSPSNDPPVPAHLPAPVTGALESVWADTPEGCISVWSGDREAFVENAAAPVAPASVLKLFTGVAALDVLGRDARLTTGVTASSPPSDGVIVGDLWLVGGGDPVLGTMAWAGRQGMPLSLLTSLDVLADRVVAAGIRQVSGSVVGDDSRYDAARIVESWPDRFVEDGEVGPLSALTVNDGFRVWGHPGDPFDDPAVGAAETFTELLRARGVTVGNRPARGVATGGQAIASIESPHVGELVTDMLRNSDNGTAELLVRELGFRTTAEGSTAAGTRVIADVLAARGLVLDGTHVADGSGLSDESRVTCEDVTALLVAARDELRPRLPVPGESGTLSRRFLGTSAQGQLRAKTGSVDGVAALAGYLDRDDGVSLIFTYVINGLDHDASGRAQQDAFVAALLAR